MLLQLYFILLLFIFFVKKIRSVAILFVLVQIISLSGIYFTGKNYEVTTFLDFFNLIFTATILTIIIAPWIKFSNIKIISTLNEKKIEVITRILLIISAFCFVVLSTTAIIVFMLVDDINAFKYAEGVSTEFYYSMPINVKFFILSTNLYYFSYFLIPLHFYYLSRKKIKPALICFIFSLNIIIYGFTYFSRIAIANWGLIYFSFLVLLYNTLAPQYQKNIKRAVLILGSTFAFYFIYVTNERFADNSNFNSLIPRESKIQDPVMYSYIDYLSQSYYNGMFVLSNYSFETFKGQLSTLPVLTLLGHFNISDFSPTDHMKLRRHLWPLNYYTFNGYVAYLVYDFGYILTLIISILYSFYTSRLRPKEGEITISKLFLLVLLIQIPIFSIFYSAIGTIILPFLLLIPIQLYIKTTLKKTQTSKILR